MKIAEDLEADASLVWGPDYFRAARDHVMVGIARYQWKIVS